LRQPQLAPQIERALSEANPDGRLVPPVWRRPDGAPVSCREKLKVLNENLEELRQMAQDALEDAIVMGCDEAQVRETLDRLVQSLKNPYVGGDR
jgi:hypothetical protein